MEDLREQLLADYADAWRPQDGDVLIGEIVAIDERAGFGGRRYPIITVRQEDGVELAFHAYHEVAMDELASQKPKVGETIGIAYRGRHPEKAYARYRIKLVRDEVDWTAIREKAGQEAARADSETPAADDDAADDDIPF